MSKPINDQQHVEGTVELSDTDAQQVSGGAGTYLRGSIMTSAGATSLGNFVSSGGTARAGTPGTTLCHLKTTETLFGCKSKITR